MGGCTARRLEGIKETEEKRVEGAAGSQSMQRTLIKRTGDTRNAE
jgi:hypothetical protein